jgi:hypothetical protein
MSASFHQEGRFRSIKLIYPRHFLLKCLYQVKKVKGHVCVGDIEFASYYDFSIRFRTPTVGYFFVFRILFIYILYFFQTGLECQIDYLHSTEIYEVIY